MEGGAIDYLTDFLTSIVLIFISDPVDLQRVTNKTRKLGTVIIRGTQVSLVSPQEGVEEIANPFIAADDED